MKTSPGAFGQKLPLRKAQQRLMRLIEQEWPELPYIMMRITAEERTRGKKRFYWRDQCVHCGDIELNLIRSISENGASTCTAIYSREDYSREDFRHDFLVPLHPSLEDRQLRWSAPGICDTANLTSEELVEVLLTKLVTFDTEDSAQSRTSSLTSPDSCSSSPERQSPHLSATPTDDLLS